MKDTHHTDAERADCPVCGGKPFIRRSHDADGMRWSHVECKSCGLRTRGKWAASSSDECPIFFQEVWEEWPRRVPAAPVPQVTPEMVAAAEEAYMPFGDMGLAIQCALSAAPQQPEASPVQMPEPAGWVYSFIHSSATGKPDLRVDSITTDRDRAYSEGHSDQFALYTEHQVRQLLAQHGIK